MSVTAWRLVHISHIDAPLNGEGSKISGGRWNNKGTAVVYAAQTISLSILEILVRIIDSSDLTNYRFLSITFGESQIERMNTADLPKTWKSLPPLSETQQLGTRWVNEKRSLVLAVPSVIIPSEWNYMINPIHPEFSTLSISEKSVEFTFDERLLSYHRL